MKNKQPLVTIFFQTYNRHKLLIPGLESIFRQTFTNFEVIIFDNGSTPPVVPPSYILTDQRFRVVRNEDNKMGRSKVYHTVRKINTKYTAFLFDDDRWEDEKLARQVEILEKEEALAGCFTHVALIDSNENLMESTPGKNNIFDQDNRSRSEWAAHFFRYGNCLCQPSSLLRTEALKHSLNSTYYQLPDFAIWVNLLAYGNIHIIQEPLTRFNCASDIGRESAMDKTKTHRLFYEQSRILHQFRKLPASVLGPAFGLTQDIAESDIPDLLFNVAHRCGTEWHFRFAAELAEEQLTAHIQKGNHEESALWSERYAKVSGKQVVETSDNLESGIAQFQAGNFDAALQSLSHCIAANPSDIEAYFYLSLICVAMGMMEQSTSLIQQALTLAPERFDLLAQLGEYCLEKGQTAIGKRLIADAIAQQPDLLPAYPGLAEAMRRTGELTEAVSLLESVARYPGPTQSAIVSKLLELLIQQGNLEGIVATCSRARQDLTLQGLGIRLQTRTSVEETQLRQSIEYFYSQLHLPPEPVLTKRDRITQPIKIAFILSDFQRVSAASHLELLLRCLPTSDFFTILVNNDSNAQGNELAERSSMLVDCHLPCASFDDDKLVQALNSIAPDILIDLDGPNKQQRLAVICRTESSLKLSWNDLPPWGLPGVRQMCGELLHPDSNNKLPPLPLAGLGEFFDFPAVDVAHIVHDAPYFACLSPAIRVSQDSWECYAKLLSRLPEAFLVINLGELEDPAGYRIADIFTSQGVSNERLIFLRANDAESLCAIWNEVDIGLAPLHGDGDDALPTCLWMERPYVALDSPHAWNRRPAALLQANGFDHLIAVNIEKYLEIAEHLVHERSLTPKREHLRNASLTSATHFVDDFAQRLIKALNAS